MSFRTAPFLLSRGYPVWTRVHLGHILCSGLLSLGLSACARPTLAEAERELWGDPHDAGHPHVDAGSTVPPGTPPPTPDTKHDAGTTEQPPPPNKPDAGNTTPGQQDSGTSTPVVDAGNVQPPPVQDAGGGYVNPTGCPTDQPSLFTGKPCFMFQHKCVYGSVTCQCGGVVWVCN